MRETELPPTAEAKTADDPTNQPPATVSERLLLFVIALLVIGIDQFSKYLVESNLALYEVYAPIPSLESIFRFFHIYNTGATFGLFPNGGEIFRILAIFVSLGIVYFNHVLPGQQPRLRLALGLQMGGALGNMIDRFRLGHVTDFIDIGPWYIFNLADLAVVSGAVILGVLFYQETRELKARQAKINQQDAAVETAVPPQTDPSHE